MSIKQKTLSLIIPVYNEENYLRACLESIAAQSIRPLEVIVVDNNSDDNSISVAKQFSFVKVVTEKRQHQAFAQHTGFGLARGDIVGRIDADTVLPEHWIKDYLQAFSKHPEAVALSGSGQSYDVVLRRVGELIFLSYCRLASFIAGHRLLWGSNCAFRREAWDKIKDDLLLRNDIWEDYDLAFALAKHGEIRWIDSKVVVSYRAVQRNLPDMVRYQLRSIRTFYYRKGLITALLFVVVWSSLALFVPILASFDYYILQPLKRRNAFRLLGESFRG